MGSDVNSPPFLEDQSSNWVNNDSELFFEAEVRSRCCLNFSRKQAYTVFMVEMESQILENEKTVFIYGFGGGIFGEGISHFEAVIRDFFHKFSNAASVIFLATDHFGI